MSNVTAQETANSERQAVENNCYDCIPSEKAFALFNSIVNPNKSCTLANFANDNGRTALSFFEQGLRVSLFNYGNMPIHSKVENKIDGLYFKYAAGNLWDRQLFTFPRHFDYGFCYHILENVSPEYLMLALDNILYHCQTSFFIIQTSEYYSFNWWYAHFKSLGRVLKSENFISSGLFVAAHR